MPNREGTVLARQENVDVVSLARTVSTGPATVFRSAARKSVPDLRLSSKRVLVLDDDPDMCELIKTGLCERRFDVECAQGVADGLEMLSSERFDAVVTDVRLGEADGLDVCRVLAERHADIPAVVITAYSELDVAIEAIRAGAHDFIPKPFSLDLLALSLQRAMRHRALQEQVSRLSQALDQSHTDHGLIGDSKPMRKVRDLIERVADGNATVLVTGESGTGKELIARAIHASSPRADNRFVAINCAALPPNLLESELFGHARGAFTDAKAARSGHFVRASGGTILLDEIGEMSAEMQAKLLRVVQEQRVRPVGSDSEVEFDTRIIAATNRDLGKDVENNRFRADLYYRINVVAIDAPPLRDRGEDILTLAQHFIRLAAERSGREVRGISAATAERLLAYDWPGNVRELENTIERAVALTRFEKITPEDLPERARQHGAHKMIVDADDLPTLKEMERRYLHHVLEAVDGNKTQAAKVLGIERRSLYRRLEQSSSH